MCPGVSHCCWPLRHRRQRKERRRPPLLAQRTVGRQASKRIKRDTCRRTGGFLSQRWGGGCIRGRERHSPGESGGAARKRGSAAPLGPPQFLGGRHTKSQAMGGTPARGPEGNKSASLCPQRCLCRVAMDSDKQQAQDSHSRRDRTGPAVL